MLCKGDMLDDITVSKPKKNMTKTKYKNNL